MKRAMGFEPNRVNSTLLKDSLKNLGDPILVREHNELLSTGGRPVLDFWPVHGVRDWVVAAAIDRGGYPRSCRTVETL